MRGLERLDGAQMRGRSHRPELVLKLGVFIVLWMASLSFQSTHGFRYG